MPMSALVLVVHRAQPLLRMRKSGIGVARKPYPEKDTEDFGWATSDGIMRRFANQVRSSSYLIMYREVQNGIVVASNSRASTSQGRVVAVEPRLMTTYQDPCTNIEARS